uniref:50S ribosomal protein L6 n=1 Tax=Nephromyces sp. ex Molgula occidentalis TaxID=2544991 RepID=A0A5C1H9T5_9APIC|nr:50S ribosomal protein L6 [Nephromyces sp. ex Molgula occidentalis]
MSIKLLLPFTTNLYLIKDLQSNLTILIIKQFNQIYYFNLNNLCLIYLGTNALFIEVNAKLKFLSKSVQNFLKNSILLKNTTAYTVELIIYGIGYYFKLTAQSIVQLKGKYNHIILISIPSQITCTVSNNGIQLNLKGLNKNLISLVASRIKNLNLPDPYKNKGIRYSYEKLYLKTIKKQK